MERFLLYMLQGDSPLRCGVAERIQQAQTLMNQRFTWSREKPELDFIGGEFPSIPMRFLNRDMLAVGMTDIGSDEWNACLIVRFLKWISLLLPEMLVGVDDAGGYLLESPIAFHGGTITAFATHIGKLQETPHRQGRSRRLVRSSGRLAELAPARVFAAIPAVDYVDRPEVGEILAARPELASASLEDVADHLVFPWDAAWPSER